MPAVSATVKGYTICGSRPYPVLLLHYYAEGSAQDGPRAQHRGVAKILVQEPYPEIAEIFRRVIERMGHETITAVDARQEPDSVDLVLIDPIMLRGVELTRMLRELNPRLPVIVESVDALQPQNADLTPAVHLLKPFRPHELSSAIELALEGVPAAI
jgi:CheY-like chemotaxis protein